MQGKFEKQDGFPVMAATGRGRGGMRQRGAATRDRGGGGAESSSLALRAGQGRKAGLVRCCAESSLLALIGAARAGGDGAGDEAMPVFKRRTSDEAPPLFILVSPRVIAPPKPDGAAKAADPTRWKEHPPPRSAADGIEPRADWRAVASG